MDQNRRKFLSGVSQAAAHLIFSAPLVSLARESVSPFAMLAEKVKGQIFLPADSEYASSRLTYSKRTDSFPRALLFAAEESDILHAMEYCEKQKIPLHIRGGGHSYEGWSTGTGLVLDLSNFTNVEILNKKTVFAGAGLRLGEMIAQLKSSHLMIPTGSCPTVGLSGLTLGGGYGLTSRWLGLTCDRVRSIKLITASGKSLVANKYQNSELFWGMRGAGNGQLALATAFEFEAEPAPMVSVFNMRFDGTAWKDIFEIWQNSLSTLSSQITPLLSLSTTQGKINGVRVSGLSSADRRLTQDFIDLFSSFKLAANSPSPTVFSTDYYSSFDYFGGQNTPQQAWFKCKSDYVYKAWQRADLDQLEAAVSDAAAPTVALLFDPYGSAIAKKQRTETAFVHRDALFSIQYFSAFNRAEQRLLTESKLRYLYALTRPLVSGECYVNYCDSDLSNPLDCYYAENKTRLINLKKKVDPYNLFKHKQSLGSL